MGRRSRNNPFAPLAMPCWLVTRDRLGGVVEAAKLERGADLRRALDEARHARLGAGWRCDPITGSVALFFAEHGPERIMVGIERYDPAGPGAPLHGDPSPSQPQPGARRS